MIADAALSHLRGPSQQHTACTSNVYYLFSLLMYNYRFLSLSLLLSVILCFSVLSRISITAARCVAWRAIVSDSYRVKAR